jgi:hypothetical protein
VTEEDLPESGETKNELYGDVAGNAFQARDVHGDVYQGRDFYFVDRPAPPAPRRHPARTILPFVPHVIAAMLFGTLAWSVFLRIGPSLSPALPAVLVLALYGLVAVLFARLRLADRCTPKVLREARTTALVVVAILGLLLAAGVLVSPPRLWDGYAERDGIVLAVLLADLAALSAWQVVRRSRRH